CATRLPIRRAMAVNTQPQQWHQQPLQPAALQPSLNQLQRQCPLSLQCHCQRLSAAGKETMIATAVAAAETTVTVAAVASTVMMKVLKAAAGTWEIRSRW